MVLISKNVMFKMTKCCCLIDFVLHSLSAKSSFKIYCWHTKSTAVTEPLSCLLTQCLDPLNFHLLNVGCSIADLL